jgi:hypothetical protein
MQGWAAESPGVLRKIQRVQARRDPHRAGGSWANSNASASRLSSVSNHRVGRLEQFLGGYLHLFQRQNHFSQRHTRPAPQLFSPSAFPCRKAPVSRSQR